MSNCCSLGKTGPDSYVPRGACTTVGNLEIYTTGPSTDQPRGLLLLLPDGFGLAKHNLILADNFAKEGWCVVVPDYFEGDALPIQLLARNQSLSIDEEPWPEEDKNKLRGLDFSAWLQRHSHERVSALLADLVDVLSKRYPNLTFTAVGYCFGGKHVLRSASMPIFKAVAAFHPSFVEQQDMDAIKAPLYIGLGEKDDMVSASLAEDLQAWSIAKMGRDVKFTLEIYPGMRHGFAARPDSGDGHIRKQYERAFQKTIEHISQAT